jgi:hypothetical protein
MKSRKVRPLSRSSALPVKRLSIVQIRALRGNQQGPMEMMQEMQAHAQPLLTMYMPVVIQKRSQKK